MSIHLAEIQPLVRNLLQLIRLVHLSYLRVEVLFCHVSLCDRIDDYFPLLWDLDRNKSFGDLRLEILSLFEFVQNAHLPNLSSKLNVLHSFLFKHELGLFSTLKTIIYVLQDFLFFPFPLLFLPLFFGSFLFFQLKSLLSQLLFFLLLFLPVE